MRHFSKGQSMTDTKEIVNVDDWNDNFWGHNYKIWMNAHNAFYVNASCGSDAIDFVIDHCEEHAPGCVYTHEEAAELSDIERGDLICGGNHCLYIASHNVHIEEIVQ